MADRAGDRATATEAFRLVANRDDLPEAWLDLAAEQAATGDHDAALASIQEALRLGHERVAILVPAAELARELGETVLARSSLEAAIEMSPSFAGDPWGTADPDRAALFSTAVANAIASAAPGGGWEIALASGDVAQAARLTVDAPIGESLALAVVGAWTGLPGSLDRVVEACQAQPLNIDLLAWCARLESRAGNVSRANDYRKLANVVNGGSFASGTELRVAEDPVLGRALGGDIATYWGFFTYRRATPYDMLVGTLPHLVYE
jgi:tetratricopeptide (TPR) repeat protein